MTKTGHMINIEVIIGALILYASGDNFSNDTADE